ncbi:MAG: response regulator [Burkholderiaceae bacterium]
MSPTGADASARGAAAMPDARLDALDAAAVGLLEPLIHATDVDVVGLAGAAAAGPGGAAPGGTGPGTPAGGWRIGLASALDRLAEAALDLELIGLGHAVGLLRAHLLGVARPDDVALELASAEGWVSDAIAFCSGQLPVDEAPTLIERLRDWPGLGERVTPELVAPIASRLRQDAERIAAATIASMQAVGAADDLREPAAMPPGMEEVPAPMVAGHEDSRRRPEGPKPARWRSARTDSRCSPRRRATRGGVRAGARRGRRPRRIAPRTRRGSPTPSRPAPTRSSASPVRSATSAWRRFRPYSRRLRARCTLASEPARFDDRHRRLLAQVAPAWVRLFQEPSPQAAREALGPLGDSAWPIPAHRESIDAAMAQFASLATVASRRVAAAEQPVDERDLSLQIPLDADRSVVENLLRELPALSAEFSSCIDRMASGSGDAIASAQRVAHTLKGSANTVGVRGIAVLTHQLEDLLQLLEPVDGGLSAELIDVLADAADCVAEMSESVAGMGPAPEGVLGVLRRVRDWTNRLLQDPAAAIAAPAEPRAAPAAAAEPAAVEAPAEAGQPVASTVPAGPVEAVEREEKVERVQQIERIGQVEPVEPAEPAEAAQGASAQEWLRVPASLIERLLAFANEASILLSQAQEQAVEVDRVRATLRSGTDQLQDLAGELERLVDVRGTALSERRAREDFDALELDEYNDLHTVSRRIAESGADGRLIEQQLGGNVAALRDSLSQLERIQVDLREAALQTRTVRVDTVVPRWRRTVRQAARMAGHDVSLQVDGEATEIDAQLLQSMVEPIAHLLRNAVDHGIEPPAQRQALGKPPVGRIVLAFARDGADLVVECSDDGRGLDPQAVRERATALGLLEAGEPCDDAALARFVLIPGFSTRARATQLSGRGIGLDVVNQAAREQRGVLDIASTPGQGMRVRLRVPVRLAAVPVIVVRSPSHVLALEVRDVEEILTADRIFDDADGVRRFHGAAGPIRLVRLEDALGLPVDAFAPPPGVEPAAPAVLQVRMPGGERVAVLVAEAGQTRNVVVRPLASFVPPIPGVDGAAVLGDGAVAPVIDLPQLLAARQDAQAAPALDAARRAAPVCLVVDDSVSVRRTMELFARDLGYEVDSAADGIDALERVARRVPALVLVDLEMPRMNGVELVRALRERPDTRAVPVIMITSRSSEKHRRLALDAGVDVFLTKPYTEDALAGHIAQLVHRR